jgi:SAM-dependent methyltransferase
MHPDYYDEYYRNEREHWWFRARERILSSVVGRLLESRRLGRKASILNVGAATGRSSEWLGRHGDVCSLEYDQACCEATRARTGLSIVQGSVLDLPWPSETFDLVCAFDVIEHVEDDALAVRELLRVLRPGGAVVVTVPAFELLWSEHDDINRHFRRYSLRQLRALFASARIITSTYFNSVLFFPIAAHRIVRKVVQSLCGKHPAALRSDFTRSRFPFLGRALEGVFAAERHVLAHNIRLPCGVSALLVAERR